MSLLSSPENIVSDFIEKQDTCISDMSRLSLNVKHLVVKMGIGVGWETQREYVG